jgi:hypothetical protein
VLEKSEAVIARIRRAGDSLTKETFDTLEGGVKFTAAASAK